MCFKINLHFVCRYEHSLLDHISFVHDFTCNYCKEKFSNSQYLKTHITNCHEGKKQFVCDLCNRCKEFINSITLNFLKKNFVFKFFQLSLKNQILGDIRDLGGAQKMYKIITLQNSNVPYVAQVNYVFQEKDFKDVPKVSNYDFFACILQNLVKSQILGDMSEWHMIYPRVR